MNTYFEVVADFEGETELLFGSFVRSDCVCEIDAEKESWKSEGYKKIRVVSKATNETPDADIYKDEIVTKKQLWLQQAPSMNFEYDEDELLIEALARGFVTKVSGETDAYLINMKYNGLND